MTRPTGKQIAAFLQRLTLNTVLEHVSNEYIPSRDGLMTLVTKPGKTSIRLHTLNERGNIAQGVDYWMNPPARVADWIRIDGNTATYLIRGEYESTVRIVEGALA